MTHTVLPAETRFPRPRPRTEPSALVATAAIGAAGLVHVAAPWVDPHHGAVLRGALFATGMCQLLLAAFLMYDAGGRSRAAIGWSQGILLIPLWASVTTGLPFLHPHADQMDELKAATLVLELVAAYCLLGRRRQRDLAPQPPELRSPA